MTNTSRDEHEYYLAADIGGTKMRAALFDGMKMLRFKKISAPQNLSSQEEYIGYIAGLMRSAAGKKLQEVKRAGMSLPGPVDIETGRIVNTPNIPLKTIEIRRPIEEDLGIPAVIQNDCNCGVLGEVFTDTSLKDKTVLYITISTGIGSGVYTNGTLLTGRSSNAGELGHIFVDGRYNIKCRCGGEGHWEACMSGKNIPRFFSEFCRIEGYHADKLTTAAGIFANIRRTLSKGAFDRNNPYSSFYETLCKINGRAFSTATAVYDPDLIILDGSVALHNSDLIIKGAQKYLDTYIPVPEIRLTKLNGDASIYGAAYIAQHEIRK